VVAYSALAGDRSPHVVAGIGAAGWTVAAVAVAGRWPSLLPWGLAGVGAGYAVFVSLRTGTADARAPFVCAGLFAAAELAFWSIEVRGGKSEWAVVVRRLALVVLAALGAALTGALLLVLAAGTTGGVGLEAIGVLAAVLAVALVTLLAARATGSAST
jgi:hypothetical protein